ncbi:MAG: phosphoribosylamine--glycine ligase [Candidatus Omnitrophica bacterium]|nr:phosphoribosylamine--glycine ligase [Candidatus Omnitrophota bacterium]
MKVLVIGSGGREHVLCWKIAQSPLLTKLYAAPGNAGISEMAECHDIKVEDIQGLCDFAKKEKIDLTVVGPESPLVEGIVDLFEKEGLKIFGPCKAAARLEGSKAFAKDVMNKFSVPTARYEVFSNVNEAKHYVIETEMPVVIKADGLAAGKGVVICESSQDAVNTLTQMMSDGAFGESGRKVVVEQLLEGEELSVLALCDGEKIIPLASSQDHKRAYEHDRGPNTGGMGAYSPCPQYSDVQLAEIVEKVIRPIVKGLGSEGIIYRGILYAGIMITREGPFVLEYNCRFGDPEAQAILPRLKSDLLAVMNEIASANLTTQSLEWHDKACMAVVLASGGYPGHYKKGVPIHGLPAAEAKRENAFVFHAGTTKNENGQIVTSGGRILVAAGLGDNLRGARENAYQLIEKINCEGTFYRRDIGGRALEVYR